MTTDILYNEDCLETMARFPDNVIDLVVTSPPYDNLRAYKGFNFDFEPIARELYRVMKPGGVVVWVVGDQVVDGSETGTSFEQALYFKEIGFRLHDTMIYQKNGTPFPDATRYQPSFEYMFIFSKGKPKTVNLIKDKPNSCFGYKVFLSSRQFDGSLKKIDKKPAIAQFGTRSNVWRYEIGWGKSHTDKRAHKHPATFPEKLAEDHILSWSDPNDLIYDPMAGSGTTLLMARKHQRNFVGSEISKEYCELINSRISEPADFFNKKAPIIADKGCEFEKLDLFAGV